MAVFSRHQMITVEDLPREYNGINNDHRIQETLPLNYEQARNRFESSYYQRLFTAAGGDLKKASAMSRLNLSTLYRRKNKLDE
jgi:DNA-binding NtrC family response regulator